LSFIIEDYNISCSLNADDPWLENTIS